MRPLLILAAALLAAPASHAASSNALETKVALESSLEKRLSSVLRAVLGTEQLIVIVNAELQPEAEATDPEIMPGVPVKQSPAAPAALALSLSQVRRISATLIVDQSTPENDVRLVKQVAQGILGLSPDRGDVLTVEKIKFNRGEKLGETLTPAALLRSPSLASLLWLLLLPLLVFVLHRRFLRPLLGLFGDMIGALSTALSQRPTPVADVEQATAIDDETPVAQPAASPNGAAGAGENAPFSFVGDAHLLRLIFLMRQSPPLTVATVLQYLSPACATKVVAALDPSVRREVVGLMSQVTLLDEASVRAVEKDLRTKIEYMMGGEDKLIELLGGLPGGLQQELLSALDGMDAALARRLKEKLVFIEDLAQLEPPEVKALSRRVSIRSLARVLKSSPDLAARLLPKLAHGMREWLAEEIRLYTEAAPEQVELERRRVLDAYMQLIREGKAVLRKRGGMNGAAANGAAAPAPAPPPAKPAPAKEA